MSPTRRDWLIWLTTEIATAAVTSDSWKNKRPADWSPDEIQRLLAKSPWAKTTFARLPDLGIGIDGKPNAAGSSPRLGSDELGSAENRQASRRGNRSADNPLAPNDPRLTGDQYPGTVRWESAKPIREAAKAELPSLFERHYVIGVSGFPMGDAITITGAPKLSASALDRIKTVTFLTASGKPPASPTQIQVVDRSVLLGFPKDSLALSARDGEIVFATVISRMAIRAKFNLKEMIYQGILAV